LLTRCFAKLAIYRWLVQRARVTHSEACILIGVATLAVGAIVVLLGLHVSAYYFEPTGRMVVRMSGEASDLRFEVAGPYADPTDLPRARRVFYGYGRATLVGEATTALTLDSAEVLVPPSAMAVLVGDNLERLLWKDPESSMTLTFEACDTSGLMQVVFRQRATGLVQQSLMYPSRPGRAERALFEEVGSRRATPMHISLSSGTLVAVTFSEARLDSHVGLVRLPVALAPAMQANLAEVAAASAVPPRTLQPMSVTLSIYNPPDLHAAAGRAYVICDTLDVLAVNGLVGLEAYDRRMKPIRTDAALSARGNGVLGVFYLRASGRDATGEMPAVVATLGTPQAGRSNWFTVMSGSDYVRLSVSNGELVAGVNRLSLGEPDQLEVHGTMNLALSFVPGATARVTLQGSASSVRYNGQELISSRWARLPAGVQGALVGSVVSFVLGVLLAAVARRRRFSR
jgi:hypothetical protein